MNINVKKNKNKKENNKPKKKDKTPRFEFYLYNDTGRIIKQYLSIHEIQQILLQQSQNLGEQISGSFCALIEIIFFQV